MSKVSEPPSLFDLPLEVEPGADQHVADVPSEIEDAPEEANGEPLPLFSESVRQTSERASPISEEPDPEPRVLSPAPPSAEAASPGLRLMAGMVDLSIMLALSISIWIGLIFLGVATGSSTWPGAVLFLLSFSFLYFVFPLAFWGTTPGMSLLGLVARTPQNQPLTFLQTVQRWLAALGTVATFGVPLALLLSGQSLADRVSRSRTLIR